MAFPAAYSSHWDPSERRWPRTHSKVSHCRRTLEKKGRRVEPLKFLERPAQKLVLLQEAFDTWGRLVPSRYLCVLGVREDWELGWGARRVSWEGTKEKYRFFSFVPSLGTPRAPQPNPNLLSPPNNINSDWVRVWIWGSSKWLTVLVHPCRGATSIININSVPAI